MCLLLCAVQRAGICSRRDHLAPPRALRFLPLPLCRARAEQAANRLRQDWQEQKQTLLMG